MKLKYFLTIIALIILSNCNAQSTLNCNEKIFRDEFLDKLIGQWDLNGTIGTRKVANHFSAAWVLNHQFIELSFIDLAKPQTYFAKVLIGFDCKRSLYIAHWMDSFGAASSETLGYGKKTGDKIVLEFNYPDGLMQNTFSYDSKNNSWQFHMMGKNQKGDWELFGDEYLSKKKLMKRHVSL